MSARTQHLLAALTLALVAAVALWAEPTKGPPPGKFPAGAAETVKKVEEVGGLVRRAARGSDALEVDFQHSTGLTDAHLQTLGRLPNVIVLRLKGTPITDAGLVHVGKLTTLKRLHLEKTAITDAGLSHLAGLKELEYLNLFGTRVSDAGLRKLHGLPKLRSVYVWQTRVTAAGVAALEKARPGIRVVPDPALDRQRAEAASKIAQAALADAERALAVAEKAAAKLPAQAQLKKEADEAARQFNEARKKADDAGRQARELQSQAEALRKQARRTPGDAGVQKQAKEKKGQADAAKQRADEARKAAEAARARSDTARKAADARKLAADLRVAVENARKQADEARRLFDAQGDSDTARKPPPGAKAEYTKAIRPVVEKYCLKCHSTKAHKGGLDLERFATAEQVRKDLKPWQQVIELLEAGEMPPKGKPQPTAAERKQIIAWARGVLDAEARARAGDPGRVPLRRLSNAEYDYTIRDLTGVDLRPTREFPADGAAGEGFTNAAEALADISPTLFNKYLLAAKDIAGHAVLLPDGFRFSPSKTRRDWTDESTARLRRFYAQRAPGDGRLPFRPYLAAAVRHRGALLAGKLTLREVAAKEKLNAKYLGVLWHALTDKTPSYPLDTIRTRWRTAADKDVATLAAEVARWQAVLWKTARVGSYVRPEGKGYAENLTRQVPSDLAAAGSVPLRLALTPAPGQAEVVLSLVTRELAPAGGKQVVWHRPRFEAPGKPPLLLRDYAVFGPSFEIDYPSVFAGIAKYLEAVAEAANDRKASPDDLAKKHRLDAAFLKRWVEVLAVESLTKAPKTTPAVPLALLEEKVPRNDGRPAINGWRKKGTDLPVLVTNSSNKVEHIPGRASAHAVVVHPTPAEFVAVAWKSPLAGSVRVAVRVAHAHPACGNGVAWWLEHRRAGRATMLGEGVVDLGKEAKPPVKVVKVTKGDLVVLAVDARDGNHACDLTEIGFTLTETDKPGRVWDLAADVADTVHAGNPHADKHGNAGTWSFVRGASKGRSGPVPLIPPDSVLGRWRQAVVDPARRGEAAKLARQVEKLLSGPRPATTGSDSVLYDKLVAMGSPLLTGVNVARLAKPRPKEMRYGLAKARFGTRPGGKPVDDASLVAPADSVTEVRLPAALFRGRAFVVEGRLDAPPGERVVRFAVRTAGTPGAEAGPVLAAPAGAGYKRLLKGYADFRRVFPLFVCFPPVIPNDEVVSLKMFHREDEPLVRLFLDAAEARRLDRLWDEHRFISRQPVAENNYLPLFIGFVTQDQPKAMVAFFQGQRPAFKKRAEAFLKEEEAAIPKQLAALLDFASRAYRRPLREKEQASLRELYKAIRGKGAAHDEAFRGVLTRVLVSPAFLFRVEQAPAGKKPGPVNDWELAARLSYFLWSSTPDDELRRLAAAGRLRDPAVLTAQARRMLKDGRVRALAVEFGTQWIHVRGFEELKEKNEKLFPTFDANLRRAIAEESILFFQDLFQGDRAVTDILNADYTFLNETLAKHYGIPGVKGPEWRRVEGVRKYGRGGVLGLASVQARQAGASRTSPVLRGNWVVETLLGEKLPRPPPNVPRLPEEEGKGGLTMRQQVEKHAKVPACAVCHVRIDPFGFALEKYDPIGRLRTKDLGGLALDTRVKLRDGTEFEGIDGLRAYLLTKKKDVIVRLFCRRLLGYALGRAVTLSDQPLIDEMVAELDRKKRLSAAIEVIVRSPQFRMIRGKQHHD